MKNLLRKIFSSEEFLVVFFSLILLICSYGQLIYSFLFPPPGKIYLGTYGFPPDFMGNLISFTEGQNGQWFHLSKMTSTLQGPPTLIRFEYILLGQAARFLPFAPVYSFHLARFFLSLTLIFVSYWLITLTIKEKPLRLVAFLLAFFSTFVGLGYNRLIDLWSPLGIFQRAAYFPHYLFSFIFILLAIIFLAKTLSLFKIRNLLLATFFGFLASGIHPPTIISIFLTFPFYFLFFWIQKRKNWSWPIFFKQIGILTFFTLVSTLPLFYLRQVSKVHPWNLVSPVDLLNNLSECCISPLEFVLGIGPTLILALIAVYFVLKDGNSLWLLLAPWSLVYILGFWFFWRLFGINSARFLQTPFYVILGILSAKTLSLIPKKYLLPATIFILLLSFSGWVFGFKINRFMIKKYPYILISPEFNEALAWLKNNTSEKDIVISGGFNGMIIPTYAGNIPYFSVFAGSTDTYSDLETNDFNFFCQKWDNSKTLEFLKKEKIKLVFWGKEEKSACPTTNLSYPFLNKVFENSEITIFKTGI